MAINISVCIATYKGAKFILEQLNPVINETMTATVPLVFTDNPPF